MKSALRKFCEHSGSKVPELYDVVFQTITADENLKRETKHGFWDLDLNYNEENSETFIEDSNVGQYSSRTKSLAQNMEKYMR